MVERPGSFVAWSYLGRALSHVDELGKERLRALQRAVECCPEYVEGYYQLFALYEKIQCRQLAAQCLSLAQAQARSSYQTMPSIDNSRNIVPSLILSVDCERSFPEDPHVTGFEDTLLRAPAFGGDPPDEGIESNAALL